MIYIGIDPGLSGAVAVIGHNGETYLYDTPVLAVKNSTGKTRNKYVVEKMVDLLHGGGDMCQVGLELVHAMPKQGVTSMFSMGHGLGLWEGIIAARGLPLHYIEPKKWKKEFALGGDKNASIIKAKQLFPGADITLKKHHGRAEALLIAEYLRRSL